MSAARPILRLALVMTCVCVCLPSFGGPYSQLVVFGDSLSDVGNVDNIFLSPYPGDGYWQGRFSNGPVYAEHLANGLGVGPLLRSGAGGTDYAFGGAQTGGTGGIEGFFIDDVDEQVGRYLSSQTVDSQALYVLFAGSNDFFNGQTDPGVPLGRLQTQLARLVNAGAKQLLVPNLPLLGDTPAYRNNPSEREKFNSLAADFNTGLATILDTLETGRDDLTIFRLDVEGFFARAIADPASFGLVDVSSPAAAGLEPGMWSYDEDNIVPNSEEYLFWDEIHPTATGHLLLAQHALRLLVLPGDFNGDEKIDSADFLVWRNSVGLEVESGTEGDANGDGLVDSRDYRLWRRHYGSTSHGAASVLHSVPEPDVNYALFLVIAVVVWRGTAVSGRLAATAARGGLRSDRMATKLNRSNV